MKSPLTNRLTASSVWFATVRPGELSTPSAGPRHAAKITASAGAVARHNLIQGKRRGWLSRCFSKPCVATISVVNVANCTNGPGHLPILMIWHPVESQLAAELFATPDIETRHTRSIARQSSVGAVCHSDASSTGSDVPSPPSRVTVVPTVARCPWSSTVSVTSSHVVPADQSTRYVMSEVTRTRHPSWTASSPVTCACRLNSVGSPTTGTFVAWQPDTATSTRSTRPTRACNRLTPGAASSSSGSRRAETPTTSTRRPAHRTGRAPAARGLGAFRARGCRAATLRRSSPRGRSVRTGDLGRPAPGRVAARSATSGPCRTWGRDSR